jgi:hypothetical protein
MPICGLDMVIARGQQQTSMDVLAASGAEQDTYLAGGEKGVVEIQRRQGSTGKQRREMDVQIKASGVRTGSGEQDQGWATRAWALGAWAGSGSSRADTTLRASPVVRAAERGAEGRSGQIPATSGGAGA